MTAAFHESAIFPVDISVGSVGGPKFMTFVQVTESGGEQRIAAWPYGRHEYDVQYGIRRPEQMEALLKFFHARKGRTHGFRYQDPLDRKSCAIKSTPANDDVTLIASATGGETTVQVIKEYTNGTETTTRPITKPVSGTLLLAINTVQQTEGVDYTVDYTTGIITFSVALTASDLVTAGYEFHVPCRFDTDSLPIRLANSLLGDTRVPIIEVRFE